MLLQTFNYQASKGWSVDKFPQELDSENTLILAFCAPEFFNNFAPIQELVQAFPKSILTGCSSSGEIFAADINDHSISIAIMKLEKSQLQIAFSAIHKMENSFQVGKEITAKLNASGLKGIFILSDGLNINGSELVKGVNAELPADVVVTGGLAGDGDRFKRTWIIRAGKPETECVAAIGFYGFATGKCDLHNQTMTLTTFSER